MEMIANGTGLVFLISIVATFVVTLVARKHSKGIEGDALSDQRLNKWLIGLSAGATANSGFVVTAGVGLGYLYGVQWLLLPMAWLFGDLIFWKIFPAKINGYGKQVSARTISDVIASHRESRLSRLLAVLVGAVIVVCLTGYTAAQWIAGQKFMAGAFGIEPVQAMLLFAAIIVAYTSIGGFRGSVYADSMMAVIRLVGTAAALVAVIHIASKDTAAFWKNVDEAGEGFLDIFAMGGVGTILAFVVGFSAASLGFGLGQPQIVSRYLAGQDPDETQSAWWIYIAFVQFTWIAMTIFGVVLRGIMPNLPDPEAGLSVFFSTYFDEILTGIIVADIFATIAATSNSLLVAMAQSLKFDIIDRLLPKPTRLPLAAITIGLGAASMAVSMYSSQSVLSLAITSVSMMGAGLAPAMMIKLMDWRHSDASILLTIIGGVVAAVAWKISSLGSLMNEAAPGMAVALAINTLVTLISRR